MARRGRTRKAGKREPNGKPQRDSADVRREADRIGPTPEMARKKAAYSFDWADPIERLAFEGLLAPEHAKALDLYRQLVFDCLQGAGPSQNLTGALKERIGGGGNILLPDDERDRRRADQRRRLVARLSEAGPEADSAVHQIISETSYRMYDARFLVALTAGAMALAHGFGLERRQAA